MPVLHLTNRLFYFQLMKILFKILLSFFLVVTVISCKAQLVQTTNDVKKLIENKTVFIGKPLKVLLKEVKPEIKMAIGMPGGGTSPNYFRFLFVNYKSYLTYKNENKTPLTVKVFLKEPFSLKSEASSSDLKYRWTDADIKEYGDLTVVGIDIYGEN